MWYSCNIKCYKLLHIYMRNVINISLPTITVKEVKKEVKQGGFASTSEFIRYVLRERKLQKLARVLRRDKKKFDAGKGKKLSSLANI